MNARYYLPGIGRFISPDTLVPEPADPQSFNRYAYGLNNPVKYTDPTGHYVVNANNANECRITNACDVKGEIVDAHRDPAEIERNRVIAGEVGKITAGIVCELCDWYMALNDGLQWHDGIGLLPLVPASAGRWGDEALGIALRSSRHLDGARVEATQELGTIFAQRAKGFYALLDAHGIKTSDVTITVSEAYVDGKWVEVVALNGRASDEASALIQRTVTDRGGTFIHGWGPMHAEEAIYRAYGTDGIQAIGVSHYSGPCPNCTSFFQNRQFLDVYWLETYD